MPMTHDELQSQIWNDERGLPPGTREVALAMAWVLHKECAEGEAFPWKRLRELLGHDGRVTRGGHGWRLHDLIAGDAPRYEPGWRGRGECEGPRMRPYRDRRTGQPDPYRDDRACGADGVIEVTERDMATGWETARWFCRRHEARAREVKAQIAALGEPPEPIPNTGGLLPRYFAANWAVIYARHCERSWTSRMASGWEPPYYGVDADEWPVPGRTLIPKRPRLSVVS